MTDKKPRKTTKTKPVEAKSEIVEQVSRKLQKIQQEREIFERISLEIQRESTQ